MAAMKNQYVAVAPREGRVSRNVAEKYVPNPDNVAPREGRVSRNSMACQCQPAKMSRPARGV